MVQARPAYGGGARWLRRGLQDRRTTAGVQVDATVKGVLLGVEAPEVSFLFSTWLFSLGQHTTGVC